LYLHVKGKSHSGIEVADKDFNHILDEGLLTDEAIIVGVEHLEKSVIDDPWEVAILNECNLVKLLFLDGRG